MCICQNDDDNKSGVDILCISELLEFQIMKKFGFQDLCGVEVLMDLYRLRNANEKCIELLDKYRDMFSDEQ